jgi:hypothetical protein
MRVRMHCMRLLLRLRYSSALVVRAYVAHVDALCERVACIHACTSSACVKLKSALLVHEVCVGNWLE